MKGSYVLVHGWLVASLFTWQLQGQTVCYRVAAGTVGMQNNFSGALGMDFTTSGTIEVVELGAFDSGGDGIMQTITVELWSRNDPGTPMVPGDDTGDSVLAFMSFGPGDDGTLVGGSRFKPLGAPFELPAGDYTIVAYGYGALEPNFNSGPVDAPELTTTRFPAITFVGVSRFGAVANNGQFPATVDGGPADRYGAGTFMFTAADTDGDGMADLFESAYGLDPNDPGDAGEDTLDSDGLTNLQESELETDPTKADTDGDGLNDGAEVTLGTDPHNPDSDHDGLLDGVETGTGIFVSAADTGTDPNNRDTDGDGFGDLLEINEGTDPNNPNDFPRQFLAIDYLVPGVGTQEFGEGLGHDFVVNGPIRVTSLGVFDSGADGLNRSLASELWLRDDMGTPANFADDTGTMLVSLSFDQANPGELLNSNRLKPLPIPVDLEPGAYTIVGRGYGAGEPNGNVAGPAANLKLVDDGNGLIEFVGGSRWGGGTVGVDGFPTNADQGPAVRYAAGTFVFEVPEPEILLLDVSSSGDDLVLEWNSKFGKAYDIHSETTLDTDPTSWPVVVADIPADPPLNTETFLRPGDPERFYLVVEKDGPPVFEDDFETDQGWTTGISSGILTTEWQRGAPANVGPVSGANGSANCFGTNLDRNYDDDVDIWLRSPEIDLTDPRITRARLAFQQFKAIETVFDAGAIRVLRASDNVPLGPDIDMGIDDFSADWESYSALLPPQAIGETIRLEFQFTSDDFPDSNFPGWYLDDVQVHAD